MAVTFFPATGDRTSETLCQDDTEEAGATAPERSSLAAVRTALQQRALPNQRLQALLARARHPAGLPPTVLHRLLHGRPSGDALNGVADTVLQRNELQKLTAAQKRLAVEAAANLEAQLVKRLLPLKRKRSS